MKKTVYIIGHRNPDTDSAVAAASYARLKQLLGYENYVAARAGHFTPQTEYIFNKFKVPVPEYIPDLIPKTAYFMQDHCETVSAETSLWAAIGKMNTLNYKVLPVVDSDGTYKSLLHYNAFAKDVLTILNPEKKIGITTSVDLVCSTLNAQPIIKKNSEKLFKCMIMIGSAKIETVRANLEEHKSENLIVIASNREDVHEACINAKVKLLVITSGYVLNKELRAVAEKNNVSVLISPYDTSSTSMLVSYSTPVSVMADASVQPVMPGDTVAKVRPKLQTSASRCLPVVDSNNKVCGLINESELLHEPNVEVILVDHNEMSQAVEGVENYRLLEVIDHHRVGNLATKYPITFINKPVGATSTLIASLFRENKISIPLEIASILLCAILTDTLILQSTTTTDIDREMAEYLSNITNLDIQSLGEEIISAGSRIGGRDASEVIRQDMKEYSEGKLVYTVSQIEVDNTNEILKRKKEFLQELEFERRSRKGLFSALLVTDIASLSSILLIEAEKDFLPFIAYPKREENVYYLKDIVSRKKQLIPMISEVVSQYAR